jgi:hypothetical protein
MWQAFRRLISIGSLPVVSVCAASESAEVNLDYVAKRALERAQKPFRSPRATLQQGTNILSETWTYQWSPP